MTGLAGKFPRSRILRQLRPHLGRSHAAGGGRLGSRRILHHSRRSACQGRVLRSQLLSLFGRGRSLPDASKRAGYKIMYWPDIVVIHIGGESSRQIKTLEMSSAGAQLIRWRMRSTLLYYRKHHGFPGLAGQDAGDSLSTASPPCATILSAADPLRKERAQRNRNHRSSLCTRPGPTRRAAVHLASSAVEVRLMAQHSHNSSM